MTKQAFREKKDDSPWTLVDTTSQQPGKGAQVHTNTAETAKPQLRESHGDEQDG